MVTSVSEGKSITGQIPFQPLMLAEISDRSAPNISHAGRPGRPWRRYSPEELRADAHRQQGGDNPSLLYDLS
jgi:hypothetical protein